MSTVSSSPVSVDALKRLPKRDPDSKLLHIDACLTDAVEYHKTTGFERFEFINQALPEVSLADIDLTFLPRQKNILTLALSLFSMRPICRRR